MNRLLVSALLGLAVVLSPACTAIATAADQCEGIEAKYRGNVRWCEMTLGTCMRGVDADLARRGKRADPDQTPQGRACNSEYIACMGKSAHNRKLARSRVGCPD